MALELKINVTANKESFTFFETTCAYDAVTNDTGWGTPNPETADATSATLYITQPNNDSVTDTIDLSTYFPVSDGTGIRYFYTDLEDFTGKPTIQDGVWNFEYSVFVDEGGEDPVEYTASCKFLFDANIRCCLAKRAKRINVETCDSAFDEETFQLIMLHQQAKNAFCAQQYDKAETIMNYLIKQCNCCCAD